MAKKSKQNGKAVAKKKRRRRPKFAAKPQAFSGRTAQHALPIRFTIANRQISGMTFTALFRCSDGLRVSWATRLPPFAYRRDGRFNVSPAPASTINDSATISGRVVGRRVIGSFSETYTSVLGNTCQSKTVKFTATAPKKR